MKVHNVALIDDHHLMRGGLASMINRLEGYDVSMEASNGEEFISKLKTLENPSIAIVDLHMPIMNGFDTIRWLTQYKPDIVCLALTFDASDEAMVKAIRSGARGFLLKNARPDLFKVALDSLMLTGYYHSDSMHKSMLETPQMKTRSELKQREVIDSITPREMEFLLLVCDKSEPTYEEIAMTMGVHRRTVDNYRTALFEKFEIKSKSGLVLFAVRWGIITV